MPILITIIICIFLIILRELEKSEIRKILDKGRDMSFINNEIKSIQENKKNRGLSMKREKQLIEAANLYEKENDENRDWTSFYEDAE